MYKFVTILALEIRIARQSINKEECNRKLNFSSLLNKLLLYIHTYYTILVWQSFSIRERLESLLSLFPHGRPSGISGTSAIVVMILVIDLLSRGR